MEGLVREGRGEGEDRVGGEGKRSDQGGVGGTVGVGGDELGGEVSAGVKQSVQSWQVDRLAERRSLVDEDLSTTKGGGSQRAATTFADLASHKQSSAHGKQTYMIRPLGYPRLLSKLVERSRGCYPAKDVWPLGREEVGHALRDQRAGGGHSASCETSSQ